METLLIVVGIYWIYSILENAYYRHQDAIQERQYELDQWRRGHGFKHQSRFDDFEPMNNVGDES